MCRPIKIGWACCSGTASYEVKVKTDSYNYLLVPDYVPTYEHKLLGNAKKFFHISLSTLLFNY